MRWKSSLKLLYIEYSVHGYILGAGTVLYMAGSLRYRRMQHFCYNLHSVQFKRRLYRVSPCRKKRLEVPIKATNLVIIIKWSVILGIDLKTALNQTVTFKWHLQLWRRTFSDWVCSLPIIKRCGSQNDCNFPDYDEIKYYIGYWCNKCFKTNDYLLLTPPFSNGEHFLDWVRSLPITKRCGSPYYSN